MNTNQKQFYDFIIERTQKDKVDAMKSLLEDAFSKQDNGTFTPEYLNEYTPKMLSHLKSEHLEEVKQITKHFRKNPTQ